MLVKMQSNMVHAALYYLWHNTHIDLSLAPNLSRLSIKHDQIISTRSNYVNAIKSCRIIKLPAPLSAMLIHVVG